MDRFGIREHGRTRTVVVTGGAGFVGSHSVEALLDDPLNEVRVLDDLSSGSKSNLPQSPRLKLLVGDVRDRRALDEVMHGADCCLHLAAQVSVASSVAEPVESASRNILGFVTVLDAAVRHRLRRLVYASSSAVYGQPERLPLDETAATVPLSPYGLEKLAGEQYAALFQRLHGIETLGFRYFNIFGPRQRPDSPYSGVIARFLDAAARDRSPDVHGDGRQSRDFVHVRDVAAANELALRAQCTGVLNVATGLSCDLLGLLEQLRRISGRALLPSFLPARAGDIRDSLGSVVALREQLGFTPRWTLHDGLAEILRGEGIAA